MFVCQNNVPKLLRQRTSNNHSNAQTGDRLFAVTRQSVSQKPNGIYSLETNGSCLVVLINVGHKTRCLTYRFQTGSTDTGHTRLVEKDSQ
jgi:hypothetical protein